MDKISQNVTLTPAYGRDYRSKADVIQAFEEGLDFNCNSPVIGFAKCSIRDFANHTRVTLRYNKLRSSVSYQLEEAY